MSALSTAKRTERPFLRVYHDFLEEVMPLLSGNEFKVAMVIYRETVGWNREQASISYTDLENKTGLCRRSLENILKSLIRKGIIRLCSAVGRWGMKVYALAKRYLTGEDDPTSMAKNTIVQRPLPGAMAENAIVVWQEMPQNYGKDDHTTMVENAIEPPYQPAPEEARDEPKETLKERERNNKENGSNAPANIKNESEEVKEEEEEDSTPLRCSEWDTVLEKIEPQVSKATFMTWFKGTRAYKRGDEFIIEVESSFHKRHLHRYGGLIRNLLEPMLPASMDVFILTPSEESSA